MAKRILSLILVICMLLSVLAGCGKQEPVAEKEEQPPEATPIVEQEVNPEFDPKSVTDGVKLTIAVKAHEKVLDYNTNTTTLLLEELFGVDLEFITYAAADYDDKMNVMVMSGEKLPDIIFDPATAAIEQWAAEGALVSLNEYYADPNYTPNMHSACTCEDIDIAQKMMSSDGNIWGMPKWARIGANEVWQKLWVNEAWLKEIGMEMPTTTEEFYEVAKKIHETDLNGNGKYDEIALSGPGKGWFDSLMSAFVYSYDTERRVVEDGKVAFAFTTEEWKNGLKYIKKFFDEGLIPDSTLTHTDEQYYALEAEGLVFAFNNWWFFSDNPELMAEYVWCEPLSGPEGVQYSHYDPFKPSIGAAITADCENVGAAVLVLDYLLRDDMTISTRYGLEGKDWDYWENAQGIDKDAYKPMITGKDITYIAYDDATFWGSTTPQNDVYMERGVYFTCDVCNPRINAIEAGGEQTPLQEATGIRSDRYYASADDTRKYIPAEVFGATQLTVEETIEIADMKTNILKYVDQTTSEFLLGVKDIDADWDAYIAELEKMGVQAVLDVYQTAYDRAN